MIRNACVFLLVLAVYRPGTCPAGESPDLKAMLARPIVGSTLPLAEVERFCDARIPRMPKVQTVSQWESEVARLRAGMFERVIFRGEAAGWRDAPVRVEWRETIPGGPGYRLKRVRYEAIPGLWIPAILYEPERMEGKVPVSLAVNGHDGNGKAAPYKQLRCINMAKRGMIVLNVEWLGMGQLATSGFHHYKLNQIDLCGTSGIALHYLYMKRALDLLLGLEHADPDRVAVSGLSGGGWQTIFISSLDPRVTLSNPVAGYSSFITRVHYHSDLGDSEQTPCDMATVADYAHLTAMRAPRPTLLTKNSKDNCCFASGHALPPLLEAARPVFKLYGRDAALQSHINDDPGTHNFEVDNRQALYRMLGQFFFPSDRQFNAQEIPSDKEVKKAEDLKVDLPSDNRDFQKLALELCKPLPRQPQLPSQKAAALEWQKTRRAMLREIVKAHDYSVQAAQHGEETNKDGLKATYWRLQMGGDWTVPAVELAQGQPKGTTILLADGGRATAVSDAGRLLAEGQRVLAVDPFYFGESKIASRDFLFGLLVSAVGQRPIGLQASQVATIARWCQGQFQTPPRVVATGTRSSLFALIAAGLEEKAIGGLELHASLGSLKEVIEQGASVDQKPEWFCFGLLESFDVRQLVALAAPRPIVLRQSSARVKAEMAALAPWVALLGGQLQVE